MDILIFQISRTIANETPSTYGNLSCPCARQLTHKVLLPFQDMSTKIKRGNVMKSWARVPVMHLHQGEF